MRCNTGIDMTADLLHHTLEALWNWSNELANDPDWTHTMIANTVRPPVPVLQGRTVSDYQRSAELTMKHWERWTPWLDMPALVGLGSVCRRDVNDKKEGLRAILNGLEGLLPTGTKIHAFGVKGSFLKELKMFDWVASTDSMAFDVGARVSAFKERKSNTMAHRNEHMNDWMAKAAARIAPAAGDQYRLAFA